MCVCVCTLRRCRLVLMRHKGCPARLADTHANVASSYLQSAPGTRAWALSSRQPWWRPSSLIGWESVLLRVFPSRRVLCVRNTYAANLFYESDIKKHGCGGLLPPSYGFISLLYHPARVCCYYWLKAGLNDKFIWIHYRFSSDSSSTNKWIERFPL